MTADARLAGSADLSAGHRRLSESSFSPRRPGRYGRRRNDRSRPMSSQPQRQLKLGAILSGVGTTQNAWRHPALPGDASISIDWYIENARKAEAAKFDLVFI